MNQPSFQNHPLEGNIFTMDGVADELSVPLGLQEVEAYLIPFEPTIICADVELRCSFLNKDVRYVFRGLGSAEGMSFSLPFSMCKLKAFEAPADEVIERTLSTKKGLGG